MLDPHLLNAIGDLELVARATVDGTLAGLHRSPFHGYSAEFSQYRHYRPGDDLKYVDWKLYARTDRIYTKQYRETTNLAALLAVDASASMAYADGRGLSKLAYGRMLAAALAHVVAGQGDAVGLAVFGDGLRTYIAPRTGPAHLRAVMLALSKMEAGGSTAAAPALRRAVDLLKRRGLLVVVSDLYDEDPGVEEQLRRAGRTGHDVAIFHVLTREELDFPFAADVRLEDLESAKSVLTGPGAAMAYRREMSAFLERWRTRCTGSALDYALATTDVPLDRTLRTYLLRRSMAMAR